MGIPGATFDGGALIATLDDDRAERSLDWNRLAEELWNESSELNARLADHSLCPGARVRNAKRGRCRASTR